MASRLANTDQLLAGMSFSTAERLLTSIANDDFSSLTRLRAQTEKYWPNLWNRDEDATTTEQRARAILRKLRHYLKLFWETQDPHARAWYIFRARQWYWSSRVQEFNKEIDLLRKELKGAPTADETWSTSSLLNTMIEEQLDKPPERNPIEESLFYLQRIEAKTRRCPNPTCQAPYFIATKKGQKFCSPTCARPSMLVSKLKYWHKKGKGQK